MSGNHGTSGLPWTLHPSRARKRAPGRDGWWLADHMGFQIRRYEAADHDAAWNLHVAALTAVGTRRPGAWDNDFLDIEGIYLNNRGEFLMGLFDGQVVAMGALKNVDDSTAEIKRMRVAPQHWRKGYGRAIFERLQARATELGYRKLILGLQEADSRHHRRDDRRATALPEQRLS